MVNHNDKDGISIQLLDNGIHEYHWQSLSRHAMDIWIAYNKQLYETTDPTDTLRYLHFADEMKFPPLAYVIRKARELQLQFPDQPYTRSAILVQSKVFGQFINTLADTLNRDGKDSTHFFTFEERNRAIEWLLNDD
ncbi:MAG: hypothetical protein AAF846_06975 [Chloroflexota bacterium]